MLSHTIEHREVDRRMSGDTTPATLPGLEQAHVWLAEVLRVSVFAMPGTPLTPKSWEEVFGARPDQQMRQPGMPSVEGGAKDGARWQITHHLNRVDIIVSPEAPTNPPSNIVNVGEFEARLSPLLSMAAKVFDPTVAIQRIAVGATLLNQFDSIRDGLRRFQTIVPQVHRLPENSTDILYQINVPVVINDPIAELLVNRLVKWQVTNIHVLGIQPGPAMFSQLTTTAVRPVLRLELDINTPAERPIALPTDKLEALLGKLGEIAKKLAKTGEFQ
jgi:hypothetical protein